MVRIGYKFVSVIKYCSDNKLHAFVGFRFGFVQHKRDLTVFLSGKSIFLEPMMSSLGDRQGKTLGQEREKLFPKCSINYVLGPTNCGTARANKVSGRLFSRLRQPSTLLFNTTLNCRRQ